MDMFNPIAPSLPVGQIRGEIIVVDDSRTNLAVMGRRLTRMGYAVALVESGVAALDLIQARRFDLMILDMTMPQMSGVAVLREVRASTVTGELPVLMVTSRSDPGAAVEALGAGADDHVVKPFDFDMLAARIERLLDRARAFDRLRRANAALDARIAHRAAELGEVRAELEVAEAARRDLAVQFAALSATGWRG